MNALKLGNTAPDFWEETTKGPISFHQWLGKSWGIFFSHPGDFTPVCTTELGEAAKLQQEFKLRNTKFLAISADSLKSHKKWVKELRYLYNVDVNFPIVADPDRRISNIYGLIHPELNASQTIRSVFIIDPGKKIRLILNYPSTTGRNLHEILRVLDSLQLADYDNVVTPVNWNLREEVIISPLVSNAEAIEKYPQGFRQVTPYLRFTQV